MTDPRQPLTDTARDVNAAVAAINSLIVRHVVQPVAIDMALPEWATDLLQEVDIGVNHLQDDLWWMYAPYADERCDAP